MPNRKTLKNRLGKCYELSYQFATNNDWALVHGYITDRLGKTGHTIDHAWCIKNGIVFDPVMNVEYPVQVYERLYGAEVAKVYNTSQILDNALKHKHYGPWHKIDKSKIVFNS